MTSGDTLVVSCAKKRFTVGETKSEGPGRGKMLGGVKELE